MTNQEKNNLLKRVYRALRCQNIQLKISRKIDPWYGSCEITLGGPLIMINPLKTAAFWQTLIHECLHLVNYENDKWVSKKEKELFENMSDTQLANLLARAVVWLR